MLLYIFLKIKLKQKTVFNGKQPSPRVYFLSHFRELQNWDPKILTNLENLEMWRKQQIPADYSWRKTGNIELETPAKRKNPKINEFLSFLPEVLSVFKAV